jgi:hypothetical protein
MNAELGTRLRSFISGNIWLRMFGTMYMYIRTLIVDNILQFDPSLLFHLLEKWSVVLL